MTAQDLTALADKLDELAMKATADTWYIVGYDDSHCLVDSDDDEHPIAETVEYRNAKLICELRNALPQITTALREAARLREALKPFADASEGLEPGDYDARIVAWIGNAEPNNGGAYGLPASDFRRAAKALEAK
jgi:hypothetical protein